MLSLGQANLCSKQDLTFPCDENKNATNCVNIWKKSVKMVWNAYSAAMAKAKLDQVSFPRHPNAHLSAPLTLGQKPTVISSKFSNIKPTNDVPSGGGGDAWCLCWWYLKITKIFQNLLISESCWWQFFLFNDGHQIYLLSRDWVVK